jgi:hypothetical protein
MSRPRNSPPSAYGSGRAGAENGDWHPVVGFNRCLYPAFRRDDLGLAGPQTARPRPHARQWPQEQVTAPVLFFSR